MRKAVVVVAVVVMALALAGCGNGIPEYRDGYMPSTAAQNAVSNAPAVDAITNTEAVR